MSRFVSDLRAALAAASLLVAASLAQGCATGGDAVRPSSPAALVGTKSCAVIALERVYVDYKGVLHAPHAMGVQLADGSILTAAHFAGHDGIREDLGMSASDCEGNRADVVLERSNPGHDVATVRPIPGSTALSAPSTLASQAPGQGVPLFAFGDSGRVDGQVTASANAALPAWLLATTLPLRPGDSGTPVFNASREVVGIVSLGSTPGQPVYAVPIDIATRVLGK